MEQITLQRRLTVFTALVLVTGLAGCSGTQTARGSEDHTTSAQSNSGTKGVVIGADCTIPGNTDLHRLEWIREAVKDVETQ